MKGLDYKIDVALLAHHKKVEDLIVYDGPVLSHFVSPAGQHFLYYWMDETETSYQWLICKVEPALLSDYLHGALSLKELFLHESIKSFYTADSSKSSGELFENVRLLNKEELSVDYLPGDGSYYTFTHPKPRNGSAK